MVQGPLILATTKVILERHYLDREYSGMFI